MQGAQRLSRLALATAMDHPGVQFSGAVAAAGSSGRQARTPAQPLPRRDSRGRPGSGPLDSAPPACPRPTSAAPVPGNPRVLLSNRRSEAAAQRPGPGRPSARRPGPAPQTPALSWGTAQRSRAPGAGAPRLRLSPY